MINCHKRICINLILDLHKLLDSLQTAMMEFIDNLSRFWILVSGCAMFLKCTLRELRII